MQPWLTDPRLESALGLLDNPNSAWLAAQKMRDDYGWKDPDLAAIEHEAYMRRAFDRYPLSTALVGLPQTFGYSAAKFMAQQPWTQPVMHMVAPGLRSAPLVRKLQQASPASWDQFGAGIRGYVGGLLDYLND